jgi:hypothetical protein
MNNDTCITVVSGLFNFHAGKFYNLDVSGEISAALDIKDKLKAIIVDTWSSREMIVFGFTEEDIHGQLLIKRWPIEKPHDLQHSFYEVLKELIAVVVLTIKAVPERMVTKTIWKDSRDTDWDDSDGGVLGIAISAGLLSKHATFCFGSGKFSIYYDDDEIVGHHFKAPHYVNNLYHLQVKYKKTLKVPLK